MKRALILLIPALVFLVSLFYLVKYHGCLQVRYNVWRAGGWEVVNIRGYEEGGPHYTVTGVVLAAKGRPDAVVELFFHNHETLHNDEPIRIHGMKSLRLDGHDARLLNDPRLSNQQRYDLQYFGSALDVKNTGPLGDLFPHPIRNLKDLKDYYDEVFAVFESFARDQSKQQPTK